MTPLTQIIATEVAKETFPSALAMADHLKQHHGDVVEAIILYGSCLRQRMDNELLMDFYVIASGYRKIHKNNLSALMNWLLPPNVYYHEIPFENRIVRAKVAIISLNQFIGGNTPKSFSPLFWARFSQPTAILYVRNNSIRRRIISSFATAVTTLLNKTKPLLRNQSSWREYWVRAFTETYRSELRPENPDRPASLVDATFSRYKRVAEAALISDTSVLTEPDGNLTISVSETTRHISLVAWTFRRAQGKVLNFLRLIKAGFTFSGGLDYLAWKIERHSGVKVTITDAQRANPIWSGLRLYLKTKKRGAFQ